MLHKIISLIRHKWYIFLPVLLFIAYSSVGIWSYTRTGNSFQPKTQFNIKSISTGIVDSVEQDVNSYLNTSLVTLSDNDITIESTAKELGVSIDTQKLTELQESQKIKKALFPMLSSRKIDLPLYFDESKYYIKAEHFDIANSPKSASFLVVEGKVTINEGTEGSGFTPSSFKDSLLNLLSESKDPIVIPAKIGTIQPGFIAADIEPLKNKAEIIYKNTYRVQDDNGVENIIDASSVVSYLVLENGLLILPSINATEIINQAAIAVKQDPVPTITTKYVSGKPNAITQIGKPGKQVTNLDALRSELVRSVQSQKDYQGQIEWQEIPPPEQTVTIDDTKPSAIYKYKITTAGNVNSDINEFRIKVAETLNDARGWAQAGVRFVEVTSGEQFEIQLIEPALLPVRYPGICDSYYSCRVGRYVMINDNRWQGATDVWTGSLRDYQHMVVSHEVGHRLGRGHINCPAPGQLAPVMQQQSINLQGCVFNPWPLPSEAAAVARTL